MPRHHISIFQCHEATCFAAETDRLVISTQTRKNEQLIGLFFLDVYGRLPSLNILKTRNNLCN